MAAPNNDLLTTIVQLSLEDSSELSNQELGENQDTHTTVQKLKTDLRQVIDKLNEVCLVNSAMLSKISELVKENNKMYTELENTKIELNELNQYGRRENIEICGIPESIEPRGWKNTLLKSSNPSKLLCLLINWSVCTESVRNRTIVPEMSSSDLSIVSTHSCHLKIRNS